MLPASPDSPTLIHGDCLDVLTRLPAASVDVVITDPPAGIGFMSKTWDSFAGYAARTSRGCEVDEGLALLGLGLWARGFVVFMVDVWSEVDRVLKPGGWCCAWALPKTADLAGLAMRSVGWDVHDSLLHLFGGGFPKGLNISKALDKMAGAEREEIGSSPTCTGPSQRTGMLTKGVSGEPVMLTAPATPEAKRWDGWNTTLSPGWEEWKLARKPTRLTYARNVLEHGCGALNIDGCRTPGEVPQTVQGRATITYGDGKGLAPDGLGLSTPHAGGRWPTNVLLTEGGEHCPVAEIDRQSGTTSARLKRFLPVAVGLAVRCSLFTSPGRDDFDTLRGHDDSGGASRFFPRFRYQAKASDRRAGLRHDDNRHPTHKHPDLMRWLVRLLAPTAEVTGGEAAIVLDHFMGSGTTGVACVAERVRFIGIERDPVQPTDHDSYGVARARIMAAIGSPDEAAEANASAPVGAQLGLL